MNKIKPGIFVPQFKGKDYSKIAKSKLKPNDNYYYGIKYDGNYLQLHKSGSRIWMFTSSGIRLMIEEVKEDMLKIPIKQFIIEVEFCNNNQGLKLMDRNQSSTGTARANFKKGIPTNYPNCNVMVFDTLYNGDDLRTENFIDRLFWATKHMSYNRIQPVEFNIGTFKEAQLLARKQIKNGGEGVFAFNEFHTIHETGRSNDAIKLKANKQCFMKCIGAVKSKTVENEWGSLTLIDEKSRIQSFGGLTNNIRIMYPNIPKGKDFTVKYETIKDNIYIQGFIYA